jgi:hypothetical protein
MWQTMSEGEKLKAIKLIKRIQYDGGRREDLDQLEQITGNSTHWYRFDELKLEGLLPEEILDLFCGHYLSVANRREILIPHTRHVSAP